MTDYRIKLFTYAWLKSQVKVEIEGLGMLLSGDELSVVQVHRGSR